MSSNSGRIEYARRARASKKQQAMENLLMYLQEHPDATLSQMSVAIERSKFTAGIYVSELQSSGLLYKNGEGWEVRDV